jgi:hypothetical protein
MPTSKFPQLSPSRLSKHMRTGSVRILHHILTTQTELWGFIKSSMLYQSVQMELSHHLSFYLRCSLRGYMVGTTTGFPVEIVVPFAPQSLRQIPQKCPWYHMRTCSAHGRVTSSGHPFNGVAALGTWHKRSGNPNAHLTICTQVLNMSHCRLT